MAPFGYQVTMTMLFRGQQEEFSHVFHYDHVENPSTYELVADALVARLKQFYPSAITFKQVRCYGPTNQGQAANVTQLIKDYSGVGNGSWSGAATYPELTIYAGFYVGRNENTGRKRFLRKYFRMRQLPLGAATVASGDAVLTSGDTSPVISFLNDVKNLTVGVNSYPICTPQGTHLPLNSQPRVAERVHIRQMKQ